MPKIILNATAEKISDRIIKILKSAEEPSIVLPGGSSPIEILKQLSKSSINWEKLIVSTTDERCVPTEHKDSNAGQIKHIFCNQNIEVHSLQYGLKLPAQTTITVLGMGEDGHFASLFPNDNWETKKGDIIKATAPFEPKKRLSLSMERLLKTENLFLLVSNQKKWDLCQKVLNGEDRNLPIAKLFERSQDALTLYVMR